MLEKIMAYILLKYKLYLLKGIIKSSNELGDSPNYEDLKSFLFQIKNALNKGILKDTYPNQLAIKDIPIVIDYKTTVNLLKDAVRNIDKNGLLEARYVLELQNNTRFSTINKTFSENENLNYQLLPLVESLCKMISYSERNPTLVSKTNAPRIKLFVELVVMIFITLVKAKVSYLETTK